jgi:L-arabinonolactonase
MYCSDSNPQVRTIWACDYDPTTGAPSARRIFFDTREVAGRPDGGTVDADGCYWMAGVGGSRLVRLTPAGRIDRILEVPVERPIKPAFGGSNLDVLFVTSIGASDRLQPLAGGLFAVTRLGVQGVPEVRFRG